MATCYRMLCLDCKEAIDLDKLCAPDSLIDIGSYAESLQESDARALRASAMIAFANKHESHRLVFSSDAKGYAEDVEKEINGYNWLDMQGNEMKEVED